MKHLPPVRFLVIACVLALAGCSKTAAPTDSSASSAGNGTTAPIAGNQNSADSSAASAPNAAAIPIPAPAAKPIVVPAGTEITVTADQAVSSKTSNSGDTFDASVAEPVVVGDKVVIPRGAKATGTVTSAKSAGKFKGNAALTVTLTAVRISGQEYEVQTSSVTRSGKGRGERTAVGAGGGAAVGALIGAIAGHGKGAAIGAAAGAGAGTAGAALTGERDITIPAETKLNFKLKGSLQIRRK